MDTFGPNFFFNLSTWHKGQVLLFSFFHLSKQKLQKITINHKKKKENTNKQTNSAAKTHTHLQCGTTMILDVYTENGVYILFWDVYTPFREEISMDARWWRY